MLGTAGDYLIKVMVLAMKKMHGGKVCYRRTHTGQGIHGRQCCVMARKMSRQPNHVGRSRKLEKSNLGDRSSMCKGPEAGRN